MWVYCAEMCVQMLKCACGVREGLLDLALGGDQVEPQGDDDLVMVMVMVMMMMMMMMVMVMMSEVYDGIAPPSLPGRRWRSPRRWAQAGGRGSASGLAACLPR